MPATRRKFSLWREEMKRAWRELRGPRATPARAAISIALGLFIGSLPIFGCHTVLVLFLCIWFQLDAAVAWIASNISNPICAPALLTAEVQLGSWLRNGAPLRLENELTLAGAVKHFVGYLLLGAPLAAAILALCGGAIAYGLVALLPRRRTQEAYRLPENAPMWIKAVERVATRFASPSSSIASERTRFHYLRAKLLGDPVAKLVADIAGDRPNALGSLFDIGTGHGQLPLLLLELGRASKARGVDWDAQKVERARRAAAVMGDATSPVDAVFAEGDARTAPFEPADTVLLVDVLHYFAIEEQDALLDRAAAAVRPGGRVLVRDADAARGWRSFLTLVEERLAMLVGWHHGERIRFRSAAEIAARLEAGGLQCATLPAWGSTPFSNVLVVGKKKAGG
jgi:uncharacterized protein (DUF2062 family)/SAM-dependent methyltransferase